MRWQRGANLAWSPKEFFISAGRLRLRLRFSLKNQENMENGAGDGKAFKGYARTSIISTAPVPVTPHSQRRTTHACRLASPTPSHALGGAQGSACGRFSHSEQIPPVLKLRNCNSAVTTYSTRDALPCGSSPTTCWLRTSR